MGPLERLFARANPRILDRTEQVLITVLFVWLGRGVEVGVTKH